MKLSLIAFAAVAVTVVSSQPDPPEEDDEFGDFPDIPFFRPQIVRFGDLIDALICRSITPEARYRLTISTGNSDTVMNVTGEDLIDCLSGEGNGCNTSAIFDENFMSCIEKASGGDSNSTETTTESSVTGSGTESTTMNISTVSTSDNSSSGSASDGTTVSAASNATTVSAAADDQGETSAASSSNDTSVSSNTTAATAA